MFTPTTSVFLLSVQSSEACKASNTKHEPLCSNFIVVINFMFLVSVPAQSLNEYPKFNNPDAM